MTAPRLHRHYEAKYGHEATAQAPTVVPCRWPTDRYQACILTMRTTFTGGDILEVGAGNGMLARALIADGLAFRSYHICDLSQTRAEAARRTIGDARVSVSMLDIEAGDGLGALGDRRFDAILLTALIEHLIDPITALRNLARFLAPGGFIYIDTPNIAKYSRRLRLLLGRFPSTASQAEGLVGYDGGPVDLYDEGHLHYFTWSSLEGMLGSYCGLNTLARRPYWGGRRWLPSPVSHVVAQVWPGMFAEIALVARP